MGEKIILLFIDLATVNEEFMFCVVTLVSSRDKLLKFGERYLLIVGRRLVPQSNDRKGNRTGVQIKKILKLASLSNGTQEELRHAGVQT